MSDTLTNLNVVMGWQGPILPLGKRAGNLDQRSFDNPSWHLPMSLSDNHDSPELIGPVDRAEVLTIDQIAERMPLSDQDRAEIGERAVWMQGRFVPTEEGLKAAGQLAFWGRLPVSMEGRDGTVVYEPIYDDDGNEIGERQIWTSITLAGLAIERRKAFAGAFIVPDAAAAQFVPSDDEDDEFESDDDDEVEMDLAALRSEVDSYRTAGAGPHAYPARMFTRLDYGGPTRLTISPEGEVTGHAILWGKTHRANSSWTAAPNPRDDLSEWLVGATLLDDGSIIRTGVIVSDGLHGPAHQPGDKAAAVRRLIEDTLCQTAAVTAWPDQYGIAVHGSTLPGVTPEQATRAMAGCPSVDQRDLGDGRGFVTMGVLCVSTCGFSPASAVVTVEDGEPVRRLVASAGVETAGCGCGGSCGCGATAGAPSAPVAMSNATGTVALASFPNATGTRAASADADTPDPEPSPPVVDLGALREADENWKRARLRAAVAPTPKP